LKTLSGCEKRVLSYTAATFAFGYLARRNIILQYAAPLTVFRPMPNPDRKDLVNLSKTLRKNGLENYIFY